MIKQACAVVAVALLAFATSVEWTAAQTPPAKSVDFCTLLTTAEAGAILGAAVSETKPDTPQGSLLGGCKYLSTKGLIMLTARPAREFDASVKAYKDLQSLDGSGAKAYFSPTVGMLISQTGKPCFVHVVLAGAGPKTSERFIAIAKNIVAKG